MKILSRFILAVDYSQSLRTMIQRGRFDEVHEAINARNFTLTGAGVREQELILVQFDRAVSPLETIKMLQGQSFRAAQIEELLALGEAAPDLQRTGPIAALGAACRLSGRYHFVCLGGSAVIRALSLAVIYRKWSTAYRYAFVDRGQRKATQR